MKSTARKFAAIVAVKVSIVCRHCGEPQLNANGDEEWSIAELRAASGTNRACAACDETIHIHEDRPTLQTERENI